MAKQKAKSKTKSVSVASKEPPTGVKVISVLYYIGAAIAVISGLLMIVIGPAVMTYLESVAQIPLTLPVGAGLAILVMVGIFLVAMAVLDFFIARGLWKAQSWARIIVIIFSVIGFVSALANLISGEFSSVINLVVSGLIGWYLWFNESAKSYFN